MIGAMLAAALMSSEAGGSPPALDTVAACYLKAVDLSVRGPSGNYVMTGIAKLLVIEFQAPPTALNLAPGLKLYDPTNLTMHRSIVKTVYANGSYSFVFKSDGGDIFVMSLSGPEAGKVSQSAQLIRAMENKSLLSMQAGRCQVIKNGDPDGTFEQWKSQPESAQ